MATMCLVNRRRRGKAKRVDMQKVWMQGASKSKRFVHEVVGTNVNPADLMTKPQREPQFKQLTNIMGYEFVVQHLKGEGLQCTRLVSSQQRAE